MGHIVFLRGANVGGKNVFRPSQLVAQLEHLDLVNLGAAGTFVVRSSAPAATVRREILSRLSFEPKIAVRPIREVLALVRDDPFRGVKLSKEVRGWVAVLDGRPKARPHLPHLKPAGAGWCVRVDRVDGAFALGLQHRRPGKSIYANEVVEDLLGVPATTRWWETIVRAAEIAEG